MRVSIVTISYNQAGYLPRALASVSEQMETGDEHILVDPGSADGSRQMIAQQAHRDYRCRPCFERDCGPADGLNRGFSHCTGDVLAYVNADDWLMPGTLAYVRAFFGHHPEIDVIVGGIKLANHSGALRCRGRVGDCPTPTRLSAGVFQYYQQGTFFRRSAYQRTKGFNRGNRTCWDRELIVDLAITGARFHVTSKPLGVFRIHGGSITGSGLNSASYAADSLRIQRKAERELGVTVSPLIRRWLKLEARVNPLRWMRQFHPVTPT